MATVGDQLSTSALQDAESAAYWAYHLGRTGFFLGAVSHLYTPIGMANVCILLYK